MASDGGFLYDCYKDNVLLKLDPPQRESAGGIYLTDLSKLSEFGPKIIGAEVLKVGPGGVGTKNETEDRTQFDMEVSPGDRVLVDYLCGETFVVGIDIKQSSVPGCEYGQGFKMVRCAEIHGVIG